MSRDAVVTGGRPATHAIEDLLDGFEPLSGQAVATDPLAWPGYPAMLERARERTGDEQAVTAGRARAGGHACVAVVFNFAFMGGSMGEAEGIRITDAIAVAIAERVPLVSVLSTGGARMQEGMRSLIQMQRVARGLVELGAAGLPHVCIARDPTTGGVWASLGAGADVILGETNAAVAFAGSRVRGDDSGDSEPFTAEAKWRHGFIDAVLPSLALRERLARAIELLSPATRGRPLLPPLPLGPSGEPPEHGWAQVLRARNPGRRDARGYLEEYFRARPRDSGGPGRGAWIRVSAAASAPGTDGRSRSWPRPGAARGPPATGQPSVWWSWPAGSSSRS